MALPAHVAQAVRSPDFWDYVASRSTRGAQSNFHARLMRGCAFPLPAMPVQHGIVDLLGKIDDKIESNWRTIHTCSTLLDAASSSITLELGSAALAALAQPLRDTFDPARLGAEGDRPLQHSRL